MIFFVLALLLLSLILVGGNSIKITKDLVYFLLSDTKETKNQGFERIAKILFRSVTTK